MIQDYVFWKDMKYKKVKVFEKEIEYMIMSEKKAIESFP